jgi:DNA-binding MarR family transcriptional regulator
VSFAQYLALSLIQESKGQRIVSRIAETMRRTGQTTTTLIDSLERQGFVRRTRLRQGDRRQMWVAISAKGRELLKAAAAVEPPIGAELTERWRRIATLTCA